MDSWQLLEDRFHKIGDRNHNVVLLFHRKSEHQYGFALQGPFNEGAWRLVTVPALKSGCTLAPDHSTDHYSVTECWELLQRVGQLIKRERQWNISVLDCTERFVALLVKLYGSTLSAQESGQYFFANGARACGLLAGQLNRNLVTTASVGPAKDNRTPEETTRAGRTKSPRFDASMDLAIQLSESLNPVDAKAILADPEALMFGIRQMLKLWKDSYSLRDEEGDGNDYLPFLDVLWRYLNELALNVRVVSSMRPLPVSPEELRAIGALVQKTIQRCPTTGEPMHLPAERNQAFGSGEVELKRLLRQCEVSRSICVPAPIETVIEDPPHPKWDCETRTLRFGEMEVRFGAQAKVVTTLLSAFESKGWPSRIAIRNDSNLFRALRTLRHLSGCPLLFSKDGDGIRWQLR